MLKRWTSLILVMAMLVSMLPFSARAEETEPTETVAEETVAETSAPEESAVPSEPETVPTEETAAPTAEPIVSTEAATEPVEAPEVLVTEPAVQAEVAFAGGDGTAENPYQVATAEQLDAVRYHLSAHFVQVADIDLKDWEWLPIGCLDRSTYGGDFTGTYDGAGHVIKNLTITENVFPTQYIGLFSITKNIIKNITLEDVLFSFRAVLQDCYRVGGIAGGGHGGLENCKVSGKMDMIARCNFGIYIGGITGDGQVIRNCCNEADITILPVDYSQKGYEAYCGGIAGYSGNTIEYCVNYGDVSVSVESKMRIGGIVGYAHNNINYNVNYCVNYGNVTGTVFRGGYSSSSGPMCVGGGIVGFGYSHIRNCINFGEMISANATQTDAAAGGIVGYLPNSVGSVNNSYNIAKTINVNGQVGRIRGYVTGGGTGGSNYSIDSTLINGAIPTETGIGTIHGQSLDERQMKNAIRDIMDAMHLSWQLLFPETDVLYYCGWDPDDCTVTFGSEDAPVTLEFVEQTAAEFTADPGKYLNRYVLVTHCPRGDDSESPDILVDLQPVDSKLGTISSSVASSVTIDGTVYELPEDLTLPEKSNGQPVVYHLYEGKLADLEVLQELKGHLTNWDSATGTILILQDEIEEPLTYRLSPIAHEETQVFLGDSGKKNHSIRYWVDECGFLYRTDIAGFTTGRDGWSFRNGTDGFNYGLGGYRIPEERYEEVFGASYVAAANAGDSGTFDSMMPVWSGSCFGMSVTALMFYLGILDWDDYAASSHTTVNSYYTEVKDTPFKGSHLVSDKESEVTKLIERHHILQRSKAQNIKDTNSTFNNSISESFVDKVSDTQYPHDPKGTYIQSLLDYLLAAKEPVLLDMSMNIGRHTVVTRTDKKPEKMENGWYRVYIYDPNFPCIPDGITDGKIASYYSNGADTYIELLPSDGENGNKWRWFGGINGNSNFGYHGCDANGNVIYYNEPLTTGLSSMPEYIFAYSVRDPDIPTHFDGSVPWNDVENESIANFTDNIWMDVFGPTGRKILSMKDGTITDASGIEFFPASDVSADGTSSGGQLLIPHTSFTVQYQSGTDISFLGSKNVINIASTAPVTLEVDLEAGSVRIDGSHNSDFLLQITNVYSSFEYTSLVAQGHFRAGDAVTLQLEDGAFTGNITGDSTLEITTDNHNSSNSQHVLYLDASDGEVVIEDVCGEIPAEHIHTVSGPAFTWTADYTGCTFTARCADCGYEICQSCTVSTESREDMDICTAASLCQGQTYSDTVALPYRTVRYVTNCDQVLDNLRLRTGMPVPQPEILPQAGYTLCGWYADADFATEWDFEEATVSEDVTLYAKWLPNEIDQDGRDTGICIEIPAEDSYAYTGKAIKPEIIVRDDGKVLTPGRDYTVTYKNNTNACSPDDPTVKASKLPQIIIQGKGNFKSVRKITKIFTIHPADLQDLQITLPEVVVCKAGNKLQTVKATVSTGFVKVAASHYSIRYYTDAELTQSVEGITGPGTYYVTLEAKTGNFRGVSQAFVITAASAEQMLSSAKITLPKAITAVAAQPDENAAIQAMISGVTMNKVRYSTSEEGLTAFKELFRVTAVDADGSIVAQADLGVILMSVGRKTLTVSAREGNSLGLVGEKSIPVTVKGINLSKKQFLVTFGGPDGAAVTQSTYSGVSQIPAVFSDLEAGTDYTVSFKSGQTNLASWQVKNAGTYSLVITGRGRYTGNLAYNFRITPLDIAKAYAAGLVRITSPGKAVYSPAGAELALTVSCLNPRGTYSTLTEGVDFTLRYSGNKTVTESASITLKGKGNFSGSLSKLPELSYRITQKPIDAADVTVAVTGLTVKKGEITGVKFSLHHAGKKLSAKEYQSELISGDGDTVTLKITAANKFYTGSRTLLIRKDLINAADKKQVTITLPKENRYYTGSPICPAVSITDPEGNDLSDCFTVTYGENTKVGSGSITITGRPDMGYYGSRTLKFTILPKWTKWLFG